jgi:hypothetical protein
MDIEQDSPCRQRSLRASLGPAQRVEIGIDPGEALPSSLLADPKIAGFQALTSNPDMLFSDNELIA